MLQNSRVLKIQGEKGKAPHKKRDRPPYFTANLLQRGSCGAIGLSASGGLSHWANNMAVFIFFMMSLGVNSIKAEKKSGNDDPYSLYTHFAMLFMEQ